MKQTFQHTLVLALTCFFGLSTAKAQCPTITVPNSLTLTNCTSGQTIAATSNYSANITSRWIGPGNVPIFSTGTATSVVYLNFPSTYTVEFTDNVSSCITTSVVVVNATMGRPAFIATSSNNFSLGCSSQSICVASIMNASATNSNQIPTGGPVSYSFSAGSFQTSYLSAGNLSNVSTYTMNTCGVYNFVVRDNVSFCVSSIDFSVSCPTIPTPPIVISPTNQVCTGSSVTLTASGALTYVWNTGIFGSSTTVRTPANGQTIIIMVQATYANGCQTTNSMAVSSNSSCAIVWPGDANSDSYVNIWDVFELGLQFGSTGASRSPGGNAFTGQYASTWAGTVSTGSNKVHADCNGDGTVNANDTVAIFNNFNLTHAFRPYPSVVGDVSLINSSNTYMPGRWNTIDVMYGELNNVQNQVYGLAFDINYDGNIIENDSIYLVYTASFLNAGNQNIQFRKPVPSNDRIYAATVRTNGSNVSGQGKIAELRFKASALSTNSLQITLSNVNRINANGSSQSLTGSNQSFAMTNNLTGITSVEGVLLAHVVPNPSTGVFTIHLVKNTAANYQVLDLTGRLVQSGVISGIDGRIDLSQMPVAVYYLQVTSNQQTSSTKLVLVK